jgi:type IV pilus assembly protein PilW
MIYSEIKISKTKGVSLIELMIAVVIGLIIVAGILKVFETSASMNRTQMGLARVQENGRFALLNIKQNAEQVGYQYCLSSSFMSQNNSAGSPQRFWKVFSNALPSGLPRRNEVSMDFDNDGEADSIPSSTAPYFLDSAYFLHGHECGDTECLPDFNSLGTDKSFTLPDVGTNDGDRIASTDVLTLRYIAGRGREIESIDALPDVKINYSQNAIDNNPVIPESGDTLLIASCDDQPLIVADGLISTNESITVDMPALHKINGGSGSLSRVFDMKNDFKTITYYVGNDSVDNRSIPTLYSVENGVKDALVQGVDRFDVVYGVQTISSNVKYMTADEVEDLPLSECIGLPYKDKTSGARLVNVVGCGWRSVVSIEVHLLLNTIVDSSFKDNESFVYSIDGQTAQQATDLPSDIDHYKMHRKEFATTIAVKNYQQ